MVFRLIALLLATLSLAACATSSEKAVREAVKEHPEIILEALDQRKGELFTMVMDGQNAYQDRQRQEKQAEELRHPLQPAIDPKRPLRGPASTPITVVVYSDFLCPHCAHGAATLQEFVKRHPDSVRILYKHYATDDLSREAAIIYEAMAARNPKQAFAFYDEAFAAQSVIEQAGEPALLALAIKHGANPARLKRDMKNPALAKRVDDDVAEARSFGFEGTPTFVVNGVSLRGAVPLDDFERVLRKVGGSGGQEAPCDTCSKTKKN